MKYKTGTMLEALAGGYGPTDRGCAIGSKDLLRVVGFKDTNMGDSYILVNHTKEDTRILRKGHVENLKEFKPTSLQPFIEIY